MAFLLLPFFFCCCFKHVIVVFFFVSLEKVLFFCGDSSETCISAFLYFSSHSLAVYVRFIERALFFFPFEETPLLLQDRERILVRG